MATATESKKTTKKASAASDDSKKAESKLSEEHRESLARGRRESNAVRKYLEALQDVGPQMKTTEEIQEQIKLAEQAEHNADNAMDRLEAIQRRLDLEKQMKAAEDAGSFEELEKAFVEVASSWADRKGFSYPAFRELGVPASVLKDAGVPRTNRRRR